MVKPKITKYTSNLKYFHLKACINNNTQSLIQFSQDHLLKIYFLDNILFVRLRAPCGVLAPQCQAFRPHKGPVTRTPTETDTCCPLSSPAPAQPNRLLLQSTDYFVTLSPFLKIPPRPKVAFCNGDHYLPSISSENRFI